MNDVVSISYLSRLHKAICGELNDVRGIIPSGLSGIKDYLSKIFVDFEGDNFGFSVKDDEYNQSVFHLYDSMPYAFNLTSGCMASVHVSVSSAKIAETNGSHVYVITDCFGNAEIWNPSAIGDTYTFSQKGIYKIYFVR